MTLEQKRAQHAWKMAKFAQEELKSGYKDYVNDAKALPALILNSGLMQVMAFLEQKGGRKGVLGMQLRVWLHKQCGVPADFEPFMQEMFNASPELYSRVNAESMAWLRWMRQMAPAMNRGE